ncbi:hypothetical protein NMY22_g14080 [Coprinellus aureogranulatus]|nr:hypothetical protein NMY22_g14080 [Coprinellus aureogranulatus]
MNTVLPFTRESTVSFVKRASSGSWVGRSVRRGLVGFLGFQHDRRLALKALALSASKSDVHSVFSGLVLMTYHGVVLLMSGWQADPGRIVREYEGCVARCVRVLSSFILLWTFCGSFDPCFTSPSLGWAAASPDFASLFVELNADSVIRLCRVEARYPEGALWILNRAKIMRMTQDPEGAIGVLKEGLREGRKTTFAQADTMLWFELAWTLLQERKYEEAANAFVKMTELNSWYVFSPLPPSPSLPISLSPLPSPSSLLPFPFLPHCLTLTHTHTHPPQPNPPAPNKTSHPPPPTSTASSPKRLRLRAPSGRSSTPSILDWRESGRSWMMSVWSMISESAFYLLNFSKEGGIYRADMDMVYGSYTYELCVFREAKQKPKKGGSTFSLGRYSSWNTEAPPATPEYYSKQYYKHGTRCWNGPERSVVVLWTCGTENAVTSVAELEKCEYQYTATTPALCLPPSAGDNNGKGKAHEEL